MKKFSKIGKRVLAFFLVALMNINTYATTTANDGSSFVTKAEFDEIVNTFSKKMDEYQSGLNAKIDNAISQYIGGLSAVKVTELENYAKYTADYGAEYVTFYNYPSDRGFDAGKKTNYGKAASFYHISYRHLGKGVYFRISSKVITTGGLLESYVDYGEKNCIYFLNDSDIEDTTSPYDNKALFLQSNFSNYNFITLGNQYFYNSIVPWYGHDNAADVANSTNTPRNHTINVENQNNYAGTYPGEIGIKIDGYTKAEGTKSSQDSKVTISTAWAKNSSKPFNGTGLPSANNIPSQSLCFVSYSNRNLFDGNKQTINNVVGSSPGGRIYTWLEDGTSGGTISPEDFNFNYTYYWHKIYDANATDLCNYAASKVADKPVRLYNGIPLTKVYNKGKVRFSCTFTNSEGNDVYLTISDEPFDNADRYSTKTYTAGGATYDHILYNQKMTYGQSKDVEFDVNYIADKNKGTILYYRLSQENDTQTNVNFKLNISDKINMEIDE